MPEAAADPSTPPCHGPVHSPVLGPGIAQFQEHGPDLFSSRARDARGRFARGQSGNPRGRPKGISNPKRRVPDLVARPLGAAALSALIDRKPHLLRPLAAQLLPPPLSARDPAERLGIDLSSLRTAQEARQCLGAVFAALARGAIAPAEAGHIARRVRARLRALRRLARVRRRLARAAGPLRPPPGSE
jgi:hypothetical protein